MFAWSVYEAPGVDLNFICHHLNVIPSVIPKKQPPLCSSKDHSEAVKEEVTKFKQAGAIKEIFYLEWLANTVVVKKKREVASVCRFHTLEQNLSKGSFPLASNRLIGRCNSTPFLDELPKCLPGIPLTLNNQEKIAFVTPIGNYHYKVIPFGLKNARSTYQRMMTRMFESQLDKTLNLHR